MKSVLEIRSMYTSKEADRESSAVWQQKQSKHPLRDIREKAHKLPRCSSLRLVTTMLVSMWETAPV